MVDKLNGNWKIDYPKILYEKKKILDGIFDAVGKEKVDVKDFGTCCFDFIT